MTDLFSESVSDKAIKILGTVRTYKEGLLYKRQRGLHSNPKKLKFQERFCRLTSTSLDYYEPNPKKRDTPKGEFDVRKIRVVEPMPSHTFGKDYSNLQPFQVGDDSEIMYFCAKSLAEREEWLLAFRKASRDKKCRMLSHYHKGVFGLTLKGRWGCCGSPQRATQGCSPVPDREAPPLTPQPHRTMSIFSEEVGGKARAGTISDFLMGGGDMGIMSDGGERGKMSGSESPQNSPRVRSFTLIDPVRKPEVKKLRENSKRNTADFDSWGRDSPEPVKELDEARKKPQAWSSDLPVEFSGREDKRASSPSPSEDSGKGTSTGSSRPSSQVISVDTEEGMRPGRSWSLGKNNVLSPLTDQVAPAPSEPLDGGDNRQSHKTSAGTDETDGHRPVVRTSSDSRKVTGGREKGEKVESSVHTELEDTLKASDHLKRAVSSPPGVSYEEEERDTIQPLSPSVEERDPSSKMAAVQLRHKKVPVSQSMDTIANKRESYQVPPSPLLAMHRFDFPSTPTHTSNRLSKASTMSGSPQLMARQSIMMQSGLTMDRPDATLGRRRRTIEEYSPLHRACKDGNVSAVWEMLSGSVQADLEEATFGAIPYTPIFLAFFSDHYQTVKCLLEHGADTSSTEPINRAPLLHLASERGCSDMVDLLLAYNADVNQVDARGNTALWQACRNGHLDIADNLIEKGAVVNTEGENHRSPLHEATSAGHVSVVELLIKRGADPCSRDSQDATPYDLAYAEGHQEVLQALQELLPDPVRPYSLLHTHTPHRNQMVTSLVFTDNETLVSGSRDCHATFWDMNEKLSVRQQIRQKDSVLGVERWAEHLVVSSTFVTLNSLEDTNQRRIVADDAREDESLMNPPLHLASFGADGVLATASVEGHVVKVWPPVASQTGLDVQPQARLEVGVNKETAEPGIIHSLCVSRSAEHPWIAVGLQPGTLFQPHGNKTVHLYDWREGKLHQIFDSGSGGLSVTVHTAFSPCGRQLAVGCDENLCVWEPETGDLLYKFTTSKKISVTSLCYSPNGAHLAVGLGSGEIQVFDIDSNSCIFTLKQHHEYPAAASALAYSENGQLLAVGHKNGQIQIWKAYGGIRDS